jgi:heterodisulfide reductase subunit A-like polyferredoxin
VKLSNQQTLLPSNSVETDFLDYGLIICPPDLDPDISGQGAALNLYAWICELSNQNNKTAAFVDPARCRACGTCREVCGYGIPERISDQNGTHAIINTLLCQDCGTCTAH